MIMISRHRSEDTEGSKNVEKEDEESADIDESEPSEVDAGEHMPGWAR